MARKTFSFRGTYLRLDMIRVIDPLSHNNKNQDCWLGIFMKEHKLNWKSQCSFTIYYVKDGYREFYSKTIDWTGGEAEYDEDFIDDYEGLLYAWEEYHNE